jgi:outer membrane lipoprotein-sorting protein
MNKRLTIPVLLLAVFSLTPSLPAADGAPPDDVLAFLEKNLSQIQTIQADFVQTKTMTMFKQKLVIKGKMAIQNPDRVAWHVDEPVRYSFLINGAKLTQWDEDTDKVQSLALDKDPAFSAVFQQLTAWFSGRYTVLLESYTVAVEKREPYVLVFTPKAGSMVDGVIANVRVVFRADGRYIEELTIHEAAGNITVINFANAILNGPIDDKMWKVRRRE